MLKGKKIVVTGGAGFIGSHVVPALVDQGAAVTVIDNLSTGKLSNLSSVEKSITFVNADINSRKELDAAMRGASYVIHLAAFVSVPESLIYPLESHETNVTGTLSVLEAAHNAGVWRIMYISSSAVYGSTESLPAEETLPFMPESPYAAQKMMGETYVHLLGSVWGMETVRLRPFNIYGPRQNPDGGYAAVIPKFVSSIVRGESPTIFGDGSATRDFIYVDDAVNACLLALVAPDISGGVFNVASGVEVSVNDLLRAVNEAGGAHIQPSYAPPRAGDIVRSVADTKRAEEGLGFKAVVSLKEGLAQTVDSFKH